MSLITLSTDFGWDDPYVGIMKGVILGINPRVRLVDLTHGLSAARMIEAAFKVAAAAGYFPRETIHVAVVDPGVGSDRRAILVESVAGCWIGPDNGLFTRVLQNYPQAQVFHLTNRKYFRREISSTFHGRDIFAPVAAHLSRGLKPSTLGMPISDPVLLDWPEPRQEGHKWIGQIIYADRFGNLITNISRDMVPPGISDSDWNILVGERFVRGLKSHYAQVPPGRRLALFGSSGTLEIACNQASAASQLGYIPGRIMEVVMGIRRRVIPAKAGIQ